MDHLVLIFTQQLLATYTQRTLQSAQEAYSVFTASFAEKETLHVT